MRGPSTERFPWRSRLRPGGGDHVLKAALSYQACGEGICHPPEVVRLELALKEIALVDRSLPNARS